MAKVKIVRAFHRFVRRDGAKEKCEQFDVGEVVAASDEESADWTGKGLAEAIEPPPPIEMPPANG